MSVHELKYTSMQFACIYMNVHLCACMYAHVKECKYVYVCKSTYAYEQKYFPTSS